METEQEIKTTYKGYVITYLENSNQWIIKGTKWQDTKDSLADSLADLKTYIDKLDKADFKRFSAWLSDWEHGGYMPTTITSFDGKDYWVSDTKGRGKYEPYKIYKDTPENKKIMEQVMVLERQTKELETQKEVLTNSLVTLAQELREGNK
jgi:hypothetical protein